MPDSIGDTLMEKFTQGVEELQQANSGMLAMDAPPIQPTEQAPAEPVAQAEAPVIDQGPSYADMLAASASRGGDSGQEMEMSR